MHSVSLVCVCVCPCIDTDAYEHVRVHTDVAR